MPGDIIPHLIGCFRNFRGSPVGHKSRVRGWSCTKAFLPLAGRGD
jgi:hypothetical protein